MCARAARNMLGQGLIGPFDEREVFEVDVRELTHRSVVTCRSSSTASEAAAIMHQQNVGCVVVLDEHGAMAGILTDRDIAMRGFNGATTAGDLMSRDVVYVYEHDDVFNAATRMATTGFRRMPMLDGSGVVTGVVTLDDLLVLFGRQIEKLARAVGKETAVPLAS